MQRIQFDENAAVPTGFPRKGLLQSEKKTHKNALGDLKNTFHNTSMGAIPKTPFQARVQPIVVTPTNVIHEDFDRKSARASRDVSPLPMKPKSKKTKQKKNYRAMPDGVDYFDYIPEHIFKCQDRSMAEIWAQQVCPTDDEISRIIQMTLNHQPEETAPKYIPYETDELMSPPPPSPAHSADFPHELPEMPIMDFLETAFNQIDMED